MSAKKINLLSCGGQVQRDQIAVAQRNGINLLTTNRDSKLGHFKMRLEEIEGILGTYNAVGVLSAPT